jgi:anti-anti-sigma factor
VRRWESISDAGLELAVDDEGRIASIVCRGTLDSRTAERLRRVIDAALERPRVLLCLDLEEIASVDACGGALVAATIERCASQQVHLELWAGSAVERMLRELDVPVPLRAYPARPSRLFPDSDGPRVARGRPAR